MSPKQLAYNPDSLTIIFSLYENWGQDCNEHFTKTRVWFRLETWINLVKLCTMLSIRTPYVMEIPSLCSLCSVYIIERLTKFVLLN